MLACLGLQSTGGRRRLVQVTGVHDTLEGAITHCAGRAVHLACGGGGWGWVSGRPGRRQAGLTAGGHGMPGCVEEADVGHVWELHCNRTMCIRFRLGAVRCENSFENLLDANSSEGRGYLSNPNCVSWIPRFAPLASSAGNQDQTVSECTHHTRRSSNWRIRQIWFRRSAAPHVRTLQGVDELSPNRPARLRLATSFSTET